MEVQMIAEVFMDWLKNSDGLEGDPRFEQIRVAFCQETGKIFDGFIQDGDYSSHSGGYDWKVCGTYENEFSNWIAKKLIEAGYTIKKRKTRRFYGVWKS
jgi:hypothetical protein